ncbi:MAG: rlx protein, partial [Oribacterium sp.]|nr:rlx protein [Oribacterium sp.]
DPRAKYIKFTAPGQERPVRGSFRNFGAGYTKEEIKDRIEKPEKWRNIESEKPAQKQQEQLRPKSRIKIPKKDIITRTGAYKTLIDTTEEKYKNSPGLQHWASVKNLKTAAASYAAADNLKELQRQIDDKTAETKSTRSELVKLEHEMKKVSELLLYAEQYRDNKPFQEKYKKSTDPDRYLRMHETQLILYDGAERMLLKMGLDPKSVNAEEIRTDYEAMQRRKLILEKTYKNAEKDAASLHQKLSNVEQYLGPEASHEPNMEQPSDKSRGHNRS